MTFRKTITTAFLTALIGAAPLLAQDVSTDYDHAAQFNKIKTYTWAKVQATDPLVEPRITAAVDHILQGYGWHLVSKNPDVAISAVDATRSSREYTRFYSTLVAHDASRGWGTGGFADSTQTPADVHPGTLIVDIYAQPGGKLLWRGMSTEPVAAGEKKKQDTIDKTVTSMLAKFPPKTGGQTAPNQVSVPDSPSSQTVTGNN